MRSNGVKPLDGDFQSDPAHETNGVHQANENGACRRDRFLCRAEDR